MAIQVEDCESYFDTCNGDANITPSALLRLLTAKDPNGCPAIRITGAAPIFTANVNMPRLATQNDAPYYNYGTGGKDRPIWNDNQDAPFGISLGVIPNEIVKLVAATFSVGPINIAKGFGGRIHLFRSEIGAGVLVDNSAFNPTMAELADYVGSFEMKAEYYTNENAYGKLDIDAEGFAMTPELASNTFYGVIEVDTYVAGAVSAVMNINFIAKRP